MGLSQPWRRFLRLALAAVWAGTAAFISTWAVDQGVSRAGGTPGGFGTVILNEPLGLGETGMGPSDYSQDPQLMQFFDRAVKRAKPYIRNPDYEYYVTLVGFYRGHGWPCVSHAAYSILAIDETKVRPDPALGPFPYIFGPSTPEQFEQHVVLIDVQGQDPSRPFGVAGNWLFYFVVAILLWFGGQWTLRRILARGSRPRSGFPVIMLKDQPREPPAQ